MSADVVSAIAAIASAAVSIIAVYIAARSAKAAELSADSAAKVLHRSAVRELLVQCNEAVAEEERISSLVIDLRSSISSLTISYGQHGGSREKLQKDKLEQDLAAATDLTSEARKIVGSPSALLSSTSEDLDRTQHAVAIAKLQLAVIRESMERHLQDTRVQIQQQREMGK